MKKYFYLIAALAIAAVSCEKPEPVKPSITLSTPAEVTIATDGGIETVSFNSTVPWTASIDNSNWVVTPASGQAGDASIKVTAPNNTTEDPVVVKVTISGESASQTVTFTQLQKDAMIVDVTSYDAPAEGGVVSVKVKTNVEVTATTDADWITIDAPTKAVVEKTFDLTVTANEGEAREATLILSGAGKKAEVTIRQASFVPVFEVDSELFNVSVDGDEFTVNINSNVEFTVTDYSDGSFPWQHATLSADSKTLNVVIDANTGYDARESYVKLTVPSIQDPVLDDAGEPTGETTNHVVRIYFEQEGYTQILWSAALPDEFASGVQLSIAKLADNYVVFDGINAMFMNPATGEMTSASSFIPEGNDVAEVINDDAGNFLIITAASYGSAFNVFAIPAGSTDISAAKLVVRAYFDYYGYGIGHFCARGNVLENGIITALIADGPSSGVPVTGAYWEIVDGSANWAAYGESDTTCQPEYVTFSTDGEVWLTNRAAFAPIGTSAESGFLYDGYDGTYSLQYYAGGSATALATIGDWANGVSCIQTGLWGDKPVAVVNNMAWFPQWAMPSVLTVFDATTLTPITTVNILQEGLDAAFMGEPSTCVLIENDNDDLILYSVDGAQGLVQKICVPAL